MERLQARKVGCTIENVGKNVKESKKRVRWQFQYAPRAGDCGWDMEAVHTVELRHSILSGKRRLFLDRVLVFEKTSTVELLKESVGFSKEGRLDHTWHDGPHMLRLHVVEKRDGFLYGASIVALPLAHTHTHTHTRTHACTHARMHTHAHTHARMHAPTHASTSTHTHNCPPPSPRPLLSF